MSLANSCQMEKQTLHMPLSREDRTGKGPLYYSSIFQDLFSARRTNPGADRTIWRALGPIKLGGTDKWCQRKHKPTSALWGKWYLLLGHSRPSSLHHSLYAPGDKAHKVKGPKLWEMGPQISWVNYSADPDPTQPIGPHWTLDLDLALMKCSWLIPLKTETGPSQPWFM